MEGVARVAKRKRVLRIFFNTFYEDVAKRIEEELIREYGRVRVTRSRVLPEFYYVEVELGSSDGLEEAARKAEELVRRAGGDLVYGVKAYVVAT